MMQPTCTQDRSEHSFDDLDDDILPPPPPPPPTLHVLTQTTCLKLVIEYLDGNSRKSVASTSNFFKDWYDNDGLPSGDFPLPERDDKNSNNNNNKSSRSSLKNDRNNNNNDDNVHDNTSSSPVLSYTGSDDDHDPTTHNPHYYPNGYKSFPSPSPHRSSGVLGSVQSDGSDMQQISLGSYEYSYETEDSSSNNNGGNTTNFVEGNFVTPPSPLQLMPLLPPTFDHDESIAEEQEDEEEPFDVKSGVSSPNSALAVGTFDVDRPSVVKPKQLFRVENNENSPLVRRLVGFDYRDEELSQNNALQREEDENEEEEGQSSSSSSSSEEHVDVLQKITDAALFDGPAMLSNYVRNLIGKARGSSTTGGETPEKDTTHKPVGKLNDLDSFVLKSFVDQSVEESEGSLEHSLFSGFARALASRCGNDDIIAEDDATVNEVEEKIMSGLLKGKIIDLAYSHCSNDDLKDVKREHVDDQWPIKIGNNYYTHDEAMQMWMRAKKRSGEVAASPVNPTELKDAVLAEVMAERLIEYKRENETSWGGISERYSYSPPRKLRDLNDDEFAPPAVKNTPKYERDNHPYANVESRREPCVRFHEDENLKSNPSNRSASNVNNGKKPSGPVSLDALMKCKAERTERYDDETTEVANNARRTRAMNALSNKSSSKMFCDKVESKYPGENAQRHTIQQQQAEDNRSNQKKQSKNDLPSSPGVIKRDNDDASQVNDSVLGSMYGVEVSSIHCSNLKFVQGRGKDESVLGSQFGTEVVIKPEKLVTARKPRTLASHNMNVKSKPKTSFSMKNSSMKQVKSNLPPPISEVKVKSRKNPLKKLGIKKSSKASS